MIRNTLTLAAVALALSGCASLTGAETQLPSQVLDNLEHCKRTYTAVIGGLGIPGGSLTIECEPRPFEAAT